MSTTPKPDHRKLPRKKRTPSGRDQAIFVARRTLGRTTLELAAEHGLSPSRISQIVRRVEKWRANASPLEDGDLNHQERQRLERWLARERSQAIYDRAIRAYDTAPPELTTTKSGARDGKQFSEQTRRQMPPSVQLLKLALRAGEDLAKAADKPPPPAPRDPAEERRRREREALDWLYTARCEAEDAGQVAASRDHCSDNYSYMTTVQHWLAALVGEQPECRANPIHFGPGTPLEQISQFYFPPASGTNVGWAKAALAADGPPLRTNPDGEPSLASSLVPPYEANEQTLSNPSNTSN